MDSALPATIGKYRVERELGRGATSTVYLARDPFKDRQVAVKRIHAHLLKDERLAARYRKNLLNEALVAGQMRHPHIVSVFDADGLADPPYIVLEYVDGTSLEQYTRADRLLRIEHVLDLCYKCCSALDYAHLLGLVHRDLKPANLMLPTNREVKITDFGIATSQHGDATHTLGLVGSPMYMSPEQVREERCTHKSDMFSLGVVVYELLTGRRPFAGDSDYATLYNIANKNPIPPTLIRRDLPKEVDEVLLTVLDKDPSRRYAEWMDFGDAVLAINRKLPQRRSTRHDAEHFAQMRRLPFFAKFPDACLWEALRLGSLHLMARGTVLMREGTPGSSFCVLLEGRATVHRQSLHIATAEAGVTLGEMAFLAEGSPMRSATAVADSDVAVLEIPNDALRRASDELQRCFDKAFIGLLMQRLSATTQKLGEAQSQNVVLPD